MSVRFSRTECFRVIFVFALATLLGAQTTVTSPSGDQKKPAVFKPKLKNDVGYMLAPLIEPKSVKKDRCDEKPRPADCDVKF